MDAADVAARLQAETMPWTDVRVLEATRSTNADVAAAARQGLPQGLVVVTQNQTAGRGRLARSWQSAPGAGLAVSVLLRPDSVPASRWPWLPLLAGVAVRAAVSQATGIDARLKWPNDVLVGDRKLAGILLERVDGIPAPAAVVGIGLNVSMSAQQLPVPGATSLALEGVAAAPGDLLVAVLQRLGHAYVDWCAVDGDPRAGLADDYAAACATLGSSVRVSMPDGSQLSGVACGVDDFGRLQVRTGDTTVVVGAGDVVHLRAGS
jgi:BirA family biotin operon repressor/biotin-[acetyl-CoA-carboxylase] ligase